MRRAWLLCLLVLGCDSESKVDVPTETLADAGPTPDAAPPCPAPLADGGCGGQPPEADAAPPAAETIVPPGCNPLAFEHDCLLPYPSDVFLTDDPSQPSGRRLAIPDAALPKTKNGEAVDPTRVHAADGFSHHPLLLAWFGGEIDPAGLVFHTDPSGSLTAASPTTLLDAETGAPVLHFAELDALDEAEGRRAIQIRPMVRLRNGARYIVALHGLRGPDGGALAAPEGFRRLRDGEAGDDAVLAPLAERYDREIFPKLEAFGLARGDVLLAWDFTVQSEASVTGDMLAVREDALRRFEAAPPAVTIDAVEDAASPDEPTARRVRGRLRVPLYMESAEPFATLHRGPDGRPAANGEADVEFTLLIPRSVADGAAPARVLQFGHGFFGGRAEIEGGFVREMSDRLGLVVAAVDWWGMSTPDAAKVSEALIIAPSDALRFTDRVHQGMVNFIALTYALRGPLATDASTQVQGRAAFDPAEVYFYGISQGHILGGTYMALSPHVRRAVLGVGGASFGFMMSRAVPFSRFLTLVRVGINDPLDVQKFIALVSPVMDRIDPITYAPHVLDDPYPDSPDGRRILMHIGIGDTSVPNLASQLHARALGLGHVQPAPRPIAGLEPLALPPEGADVSAVVEVDFGIDPDPTLRSFIPREENCVHEGVRRLDTIQVQTDAFWRPDGVVAPPCDGPCVSACR